MPIKVLYLDDEKELCEIFEETFASGDTLVETFTDPMKAIESAAAHPPDIVFVDFRLPYMTGDKVAHALDPLIPKYLITGDLFISSSYQFIKIFSKPYNPSDIWGVIHAHQALLETK